MLSKVLIALAVLLSVVFLYFKVFVQNSFVINKRLSEVKVDDRSEKGPNSDIISEYIASGRLFELPLVGNFFKEQMDSLRILNVQIKPKEYLLITIGVFFGFLLIGFLMTGSILLGLGLGLIGMLLPSFYISWLKKKRNSDLNEQLPDFLNALSNALRSGLSLQQGMDIATEESLDPVKWEFERVLSDMSLGRTTEASFENLKNRTKNSNVELLVNAINVQLDVGGNLSEILDLLAHTIRENAKLQRYFESTIAQNKLSGIIIGVLPIALAGVLTIIRPEYMEPLFYDPMGRMMLIGTVLMMGVGLLIIRKITELEV